MLTLAAIALVIVSTLTDHVSAIKCYNCESVLEANCGEDFKMEEHFKIDCDQIAPARYLSNDLEYFNATACMKKIYKEHKLLKYTRSCYFGDVNETKIGCRMDPTMTDFQDVQCFVCDNENLCNSGFSTSVFDAHVTVGIFAFCSIYLYFKHF